MVDFPPRGRQVGNFSGNAFYEEKEWAAVCIAPWAMNLGWWNDLIG